MVKAKVLWSVLGSMMLFSGVNASHAANTGTIKIDGKIIGSGCSIESGKAQNVHLGAIPKSEFTMTGIRARPVLATIRLKDCPTSTDGVTAVNVMFSGKPIKGDGGVLSLDGESGQATGVGISVLVGKDKTELKLGELYTPDTEVGGYHIIPLDIAYKSTAGTVDVGHANGTLMFNILYK